MRSCHSNGATLLCRSEERQKERVGGVKMRMEGEVKNSGEDLTESLQSREEAGKERVGTWREVKEETEFAFACV